jgi:hypothetical protein
MLYLLQLTVSTQSLNLNENASNNHGGSSPLVSYLLAGLVPCVGFLFLHVFLISVCLGIHWQGISLTPPSYTVLALLARVYCGEIPVGYRPARYPYPLETVL